MILKIIFIVLVLGSFNSVDTPKEDIIMLDYSTYVSGQEVMYNSIPNIDNITDFELETKLRNSKFLKTAQEVYNKHKTLKISVNNFDKIYNESLEIFNYTREIDDSYENGEYIQTVQELVSNDYRGDCDDYAMFFYVIAKKMGLKVRYMVGVRAGSGHAWIQIKKGNKWVEYDSISKTICDDDCIKNRFWFVNYIE